MTEAPPPEPRPGHFRHLLGVGLTGVGLVLLAAGLGGVRTAVGTAAGVGVAVVDLWAIGLVVRGLLAGSRRKAAYVVLAVLKLGVLVGGCALLVRAGVVDLLPLTFGLGALPLGITTAELASRRAVGEEE